MRLNRSSGGTRRDDRSPQPARVRASRRAAILAIESLEDRTLLSFGNAIGTSLQTLQTQIISALGTAIPGVGSQLADLAPVQQLIAQFGIPLATAVANATPDTLASSVTAALGPLLQGLVQVGGNGPYDVSARLHQDKVLVQAGDPMKPAEFGLGDFLKVKVTDSVKVALHFDYLLKFTVGMDGSASLDDTSLRKGLPGVSGRNNSLPDAAIAVALVGSLPGFAASGTLNQLLTAAATVPRGTADPSFDVTFAIKNPHVGRPLDFSLSGNAQATLALALSFAPDSANAPINPKLGATLHVAWTNDGTNLVGNFTDLSISDVGLDVGALLPGFITKIIGNIQTFTKPLQPIADFLSAEVPGLKNIGVHLSLRSLADLDNEPGVGQAIDLINLINHLPSDAQGSGGIIQFGGKLQFAGNPRDKILSGSNLVSSISGAVTTASDLFRQADSMSQDPGAPQGFFSRSGSSSGASVGFTFPIVTDPVGVAFKLLAGQNATLITFKASASAGLHGTVGAQFGPFSVFLTGGIDVNLSLSLGYDTAGLREFAADPSDPSQLLDGLFFNNQETAITLRGNIGIGAAAVVVAIEGDLEGKATLSLQPNLADVNDPTKTRVGVLLSGKRVDRLFAISGDVTLSLKAEGGIFFGPVHAVVFSVELASVKLIEFSTAIYPDSTTGTTPAAPANTIYIDEKDGDQKIRVYTTQTVKNYIRRDAENNESRTVTSYQTIVDYGDRMDTFDLGTISDDNIRGTSSYFIGDNPPPHFFNLIATKPKPGGGEYSGNHTITINPGTIGGVVLNNGLPVPDPFRSNTPQFEPLNAVLIGGSGDDTLIYHGTGKAILVGNGGSNVLVGGVLEYGNYANFDPTGHIVPGVNFPNGIFGAKLPLLPFSLPSQVLSQLSDSAKINDAEVTTYVSQGLPVSGVGTNDLVGTAGDDVLIGGPRGNVFEGGGGNDKLFGGVGFDTYVVSGNAPGFVAIYGGPRDDYVNPGASVGSIIGGSFSVVSVVSVVDAAAQQARYNQDELDIVKDEAIATESGIPLGLLPGTPPAPVEPTPVNIDTNGGPLAGDSNAHPGQLPVLVGTPNRNVVASGLAKVDIGGVDVATASAQSGYSYTGTSPYHVSSLAISNLFRTTLKNIEVSPGGPAAQVVFAGSGRGSDHFSVNSTAVPAKTVVVANAPATIPAYKSTTVELTPAGMPPLILTVDNFRRQDSLTLNGGGGGDFYVVNLDLSATFYTNIQDSSSKGLDTLLINGGGFDRKLPVRVPASQSMHAIAYHGALAQPPPASVPASKGQYAVYGGGQSGSPIVLAGSYLGRTPVSFSPQYGLAPMFQNSVIYVSPNNVEFENDLSQAAGTIQQETVQVGFNNNVKLLRVLGLDTGNTFDVTGLSALVTHLYGSALGDVFNVGGTADANRPKAGGDTVAISTVATNLGAALNLGSNSAFLGAINANLGTALKAGRGMAAIGRKNAIIGNLNANLSPLVSTIYIPPTIYVPPTFIGTPYQKLYLNGDAGNDVVNVADFSGQLFVNGFAGSDVVNLGTDGVTGTTGTASLINGTVHVGNKAGLTTLNVDDSADTAVRDVQLRSNSLIGLGPAIITYEPKDLAALNIIGTTGYRPGGFSGRLAVPPRGNTYGVFSTPGLNKSTELVKTTLTVLGAGGDSVTVLAASGKGLPKLGVQGTLQIVSPNHLTDLTIYGYVSPANARIAVIENARFAASMTARTVLLATGKKARTVTKAAPTKSLGVFAALHLGTKKTHGTQKTLIVARSKAASRAAIIRNGRSAIGGPAQIAVQPTRSSPLTGGVTSTGGSRAFDPRVGGSTTNGKVFLPTIVIDSDHVSGLTPGDILYGADELTSLTVTTPAGGRFVNVVGTPNRGAVGSTQTSLIGHGLDSINVGGPSLSRVQGTLNITNQTSRSSLIVDGSGDPAKQVATISLGLIRGLAPADITYDVGDVNTIDLRGGTGGNRFHVVATRFGSPVSIDGGSGANTLVGPNLANTWNITSNDAGDLGNPSFPALGGPAQRDVTFSRIGSLTGGTLADTFLPSNGANLSGRIDGGAGVNTLDLSAQTRNVAVDLRTGVATGIKGGVANIANVNGGRGTSVLVGDANPNVLRGGSGRNLLIGGGGVDQVLGGPSDNILIGGGVTADLTLSALDSIMAEFARADDDFLTRLTHILSGNGTNDPAYLNPTTVVNDGAANVLTGGIGANWFFAPDALSPKGRKLGDVVTIIK